MEKCEIYRPAGGRLQARTLGSRLSAGETHLSPFSRRLNTCDNARQRRSTLTFSDASTGCRVSTIERHCVELINGNLRDRRRGSILEPAVFSIQSLSLSRHFFDDGIFDEESLKKGRRKKGSNCNEMGNGEWRRQLNKRGND